jgi:O-acetyl-ADP-ribose deacetylase (regulator of RNase III)
MNTESNIEWPWYLMLRATSPELVMAWMEVFPELGPWSVGSNHILREKADAIVSPANSYGFMDGGIDLVYRNHFGLGIQTRLQHYLEQNYNGFLPVGEAIVIPTLNDNIPHMIVAPTMERPMDVNGTQNAYLAMRAILSCVSRFNRHAEASGEKRIYRILCPGLCTGIGRMSPDESARQVRKAIEDDSPLLAVYLAQLREESERIETSPPESEEVRSPTKNSTGGVRQQKKRKKTDEVEDIGVPNRNYNMVEDYSEGEVIAHPLFGAGRVISLRGNDKMEVKFSTGSKILLRNNQEK